MKKLSDLKGVKKLSVDQKKNVKGSGPSSSSYSYWMNTVTGVRYVTVCGSSGCHTFDNDYYVQ